MTDAAEVPTEDMAAAQAVVILSGLSGGGKTAAAKLFEDLGYTVVDNLPGELLPDLADLVSSDMARFAQVAIVLDVRSGDAVLALAAMRGALEGRQIEPRIVFLEASDDVLIRRFSETRHRHPLADGRGIASSINEERRLLCHYAFVFIQYIFSRRYKNTAAIAVNNNVFTVHLPDRQISCAHHGRNVERMRQNGHM